MRRSCPEGLLDGSWTRARISSFGLILLGLFLSPGAHADFFLHYWENQYENKQIWRFRIDGSGYLTTSNFDGSGTASVPAGLANYLRMQGDLTATHGIFNRFSLFGRVSWAYINQNGTARPASGFGFTDQSVGATYRLYENHLTSLDLQAQADIPGYSLATADATLTPYLGDGTLDFTGGAFLTVPIFATKTEVLSAVVGGGYTYRTLGFSAAAPWSATLRYLPNADGFFASISGLGMVSLKTDPNGLSLPPRSSIGSAGSFITGDSNSTLIMVRGKIGYRFNDSLEVFGYGTQSIWGMSAPNGLNVGVGFQTRMGSGKHMNPALLSPLDYGKSNQGFVNYSLEAKVLRVNDRLNLIKINKGLEDGVEMGQIFDIFIIKKDGSSGGAIARGTVTSVKVDESALEITDFFKEVWVEEGFIARRLIQ